MFACFTFVSSQTYLVFCLTLSITFICVVSNVLCVLFSCSHVLHLCCLKRTTCSYFFSVRLFVKVAFVLSQTCLVLLKYLLVLQLCRHNRLVGPFECFAFVSSQTYDGFFLTVCMFTCICVVTNVWCVLSKCLPVLHLRCHKRMMGTV